MFVIKDKTNNKFLYEKNLLPKLENSVNETQSGKKALDAHQGKVLNDKIVELNADIANRVTIAQGSENVGKYLKVGEDGNVSPTELSLKTINNTSIFGSGNIAVVGNDNLELLEDITISDTVSTVKIPLKANHQKGFKNIIVFITIPKGSTFSNAMCLFGINNTINISRVNTLSQNANYPALISSNIYIKNGRLYGLAANCVNITSNYGGFYAQPNGLGLSQCETIDSLSLNSYSNMFIEGTTIKVWGV